MIPADDDEVTDIRDQELLVQSAWGDSNKFPAELLQRIFANVVLQDGCLPSLIK